MSRLENRIYNALEAEERFFDEMRPKSIGAYSQRMSEHLVNIADLEDRLEIEKALFKFSRRQFKNAVNGMAYDQGFRCPFCKADFGHDKAEFEKHMKEEEQTPSIEALAMTNFADTLKNVVNPKDNIL